MRSLTETRIYNSTASKLLQLSVIVTSGEILETISDIFLKRNALPEPIDLPDHIGNLREGSIATSAACGVIGMFACVGAAFEHDSQKFRRRAKMSAIAAVAISSAAQFVGEKYGISNQIGAENVSDMVDAIYGSIWSGATGVFAYKYAVATEEGIRLANERASANHEPSLVQLPDMSA